MKKDNAAQVLSKLMAQLAIPVTRQSISDELEKHPDHNTLLAFSDVLDRWNVPNAAYKASIEQLRDLPKPYIARLKNEFVIVERFPSSGARYCHTKQVF